MEAKQAAFEGWAIISKFGHATHVGFVTTEAYGAAVLFRCDTPELPEREYILERPEWATDASGNSRMCPVGAKVKRPGTPAESILIGPAAIYDMRPCTEATARHAIEKLIRRDLILLDLPAKTEAPQVTWPEDETETEEEDEEIPI